MSGLATTFRSLGAAHLLILGGVGVGIILFFVFLTSKLTTPDMVLLFGDLDMQDSGAIVSKLDTLNVPYELSGNGTRIMVPGDQVLRLRMAMAEDGLPSGGSIGYEIFDRSESLGTTNFVQNINLVRALEGELARTIRSISGVQASRVHLVLPRRQLFSREEQEPSASVVLQTRGNSRINAGQVLAIQQLVAAADLLSVDQLRCVREADAGEVLVDVEGSLADLQRRAGGIGDAHPHVLLGILHTVHGAA